MISQTLVVAAMAGAVAALVTAELRGSRICTVVAKAIASAGFVLLALLRTDLSSGYDRWVVLALALCLLGDLLLLVPRAFAASLASFLLGHLAYTGAFCTVLAPRAWPPLVGVVLALASGIAAIWLWAHLGGLRAAVLGYVAAITVMTWGAIATAGRTGWLAGAAGVLFYVSDLTVARDRFVVRRFASRAWGLPAYYLAQVLFALTVGRGSPSIP
jgi:uncharacterized membrane protein YhhN